MKGHGCMECHYYHYHTRPATVVGCHFLQLAALVILPALVVFMAFPPVYHYKISLLTCKVAVRVRDAIEMMKYTRSIKGTKMLGV